MPVFDCHTHAFPDAIAAGAVATLTAEARWVEVCAHTDGTTAGLIRAMDAAGVDACMLLSVATKPAQVTKITDWSKSVMSERIFPFASIHPDYPDPEVEAQRIASLGIRGLKFHPQYMRCPLDDPRVVRIAKAAADAGLAMAFHMGHDLAFERSDIAAPRRLLALHETVPDLRILACHLGGWYSWEESLACLAGKPIYMDTSFVFDFCDAELLARLFDNHPTEYLLFGTDSPWADIMTERERLMHYLPDSAAIQAICWDNARRFVGIEKHESTDRRYGSAFCT